MALTEDQKKYLVLGTVGGAFALFVGSLIFGDSKATAAPMLGRPGTGPAAPGAPGHHGKQHTKRRHNDEGDGGRDRGDDNDRGEYGRKKKHHHKGHRHGH